MFCFVVCFEISDLTSGCIMGGSEHASYATGIVCMTGGLVAYFKKGSAASLTAGGVLCRQVRAQAFVSVFNCTLY